MRHQSQAIKSEACCSPSQRKMLVLWLRAVKVSDYCHSWNQFLWWRNASEGCEWTSFFFLPLMKVGGIDCEWLANQESRQAWECVCVYLCVFNFTYVSFIDSSAVLLECISTQIHICYCSLHMWCMCLCLDQHNTILHTNFSISRIFWWFVIISSSLLEAIIPTISITHQTLWPKCSCMSVHLHIITNCQHSTLSGHSCRTLLWSHILIKWY